MANIYWVFTIARNHRAQLLDALYLCYWQYGTAQWWPGDTLDKWILRPDPDLLSQNSGGEGDDRGRDGWMASPTQWSWVWASSRRWWGTGRPGVLQSMGSQRVGQDSVTEWQWLMSMWKFESAAPSVTESLPLCQEEDAKHSHFTGKETESQGNLPKVSKTKLLPNSLCPESTGLTTLLTVPPSWCLTKNCWSQPQFQSSSCLIQHCPPRYKNGLGLISQLQRRKWEKIIL